MGHSPNCRGPYTPDDTGCYCGYSYDMYCVRTIDGLQDTLGVSYVYWNDKQKAVEDLKLAAVHHVAWKAFAIRLLALATDTDPDLWVDEVLPPAEILDRPDAMFDLIVKLKLKAEMT